MAEHADSITYEALTLFGPQALRDRARLRKAYRRLAFLHHPDRNGASAASFAHFKRITRVYRYVDSCLESGGGVAIQSCARCGERPAERPGLDRNLYCRDCLVYAGARRLLPAPPAVVVRCGFSIIAMVWACAALGMMLQTQRVSWGVQALVAAIVGLALLAYLAVSIPVVQRRSVRRRSRRWSAPLLRATMRA